jgi:hypothetical protein
VATSASAQHARRSRRYGLQGPATSPCTSWFHNVEQLFSLYKVDHTLLAGVPNNAFTAVLSPLSLQARSILSCSASRKNVAAQRRSRRPSNGSGQSGDLRVALVAVWHWLQASTRRRH